MSTEVIVKNPISLSLSLWSMKNAKQFCDASVIVNGKVIPVHKVVLASVSEYCKSLFEKSSQNVITFQNVDSNALERLLKYCYTGKIKVTLENANEVLPLARILSLDYVLEKSLEIFGKTHSFDSCLSSWNVDQMGVITKMYGEKNCLTNHSPIKVDSVSVDKIKIKETSVAAGYRFGDNVEKTDSKKKNTLLVIGGDQLLMNKIEIFDISKNNWLDIGIYIDREDYVSLYLYENKILTIGGKQKFSQSVSVNTVKCYDLASQLTEDYPDMKYSRKSLAAVTVDRIAFAIGGIGIDSSILSKVEKFDSSANIWIEVTPMTTARCKFGAAVWHNDIYVVGGEGICNTLASTEAYSVAENRWRSCAPLNRKRYRHGVAEVRGHLYAVGGSDAGKILNSVEMYDFGIDKWTLLDQSIDPARNGLAAANFKGNLVIAGGVSDNNSATVEVLDSLKGIWEKLVPLKYNRHDFNMLEIPYNLVKNIISNSKLFSLT